MTTTKETFVRAFHEASHAVTAHVLGDYLDYVTIKRSSNDGGHAKLQRRLFRPLNEYSIGEARQRGR